MTTTEVKTPEVNLIRASNISQCLFDFSNIITRQAADGIVILNMNDLMAIARETSNQGEYLKEIVSKIPMEYAVICYMDARELYDKWRVTHVNANGIDRKEEDILLEFTKQLCVTYAEIYTHAGFAPKQVNTLISFRYDAMHITGFDFKKFIMSCVHTTVKYVTKTFDSQFWLIGDYKPVDYNHIAAKVNFLAMITHDFRVASFTDIIHKGGRIFTTAPGMIPDLTLPYMREYVVTKTVMASNRLECIKRLVSQRDKIRAQYERIIETSDPSSHMVICLNLDPEFDSNLLEPIKSLWSSHPYIINRATNNKTTGPVKSVNGGASQLESLINMLGMAAASASGCDDGCDMPVGRGKDTITTDIIITTSHPGSLHELFGGNRLNSNNSAKNTIANTRKNDINYVQLPVLKFGNSQFQPSKLSGLNNLKFPTAGNGGSINVIIGQNITWQHFQQITEYIISNPKYPNNIQAKYVDFKINPMIRINLGMMKYATEYFTLNQLGRPMDHSACNKLYTRFIQWANWVKLSSRLEHSSSDTSGKTPETKHEECTCCKCISKKGMARYEVGNLPFVDSTVQSIIQETTTFWIPRL